MVDILLATDADWMVNECKAAFDGYYNVAHVRRGADVINTIKAQSPRLVLLDMQIGNMGGIATCMAIRQEEDMGRLERCSVIMLLDRDVDDFLAQRSNADAWLVKPINYLRLTQVASNFLM